jgi:GH18 family chitinase
MIGYYKAWSDAQQCYAMVPKGILVDGLPNFNFAFAHIEPGMYKVTTIEGNTPSPFRDLADVASMKPGTLCLQVVYSATGSIL